MTSNTRQLPNGYKPADKTLIRGRLNNLSPLDKGLRSLIVKDKNIKDEKDATEKSKPPIPKLKSISDIISNNIQASNDLRTITHYIKRAEQIWTTLLLKPNGDQKQLLIYDTESSEYKNSKLHELLIQKLENYFTTKYPFEEYIPQIIKDVLFRTGSYIHINMSHAVLDHLINGMEVDGKESFRMAADNILATQFVDRDWNKAKNLGFIRKEKKSGGALGGLEALYGQVGEREAEYHLLDPALKFTFTDNPIVLKVGQLARTMREERLANMTGMEGINSAINNVFTKQKGSRKKTNKNHVGIMQKKTLDEELSKLYPNRHYDHAESLSVRKGKFYTGNGRGIGININPPTESVITVNINGEIGKPFGLIVLFDPETGECLKNTTDVKFYQGTNQNSPMGKDSGPKMGTMNEVISHIRRVADGAECNEDMGWMAEFASAELEKQMIEGFINGDLKKDVTISLTEENKKLWMSRALRDQGVRAVFIPYEYCTYVATDFNRLGVGRSLVDEAKMHIGRLAVLQTANALAQVENAISHTTLNVTPEREDVDIRNTAMLVRDEWFSGNPTLHDIMGYNNVSIDAVLDRFKEQSVTVKINASDNPHTVAPEINAEQTVREPLKTVDPDTIEGLLNTVAGFFGLKRSWLEDTGDGNDFAIEALADQELLRNQTNDYSKTFSKFFTDIIRKHVRVNEPLVNELFEVIKENKKLYTKPDQTGDLELKDEDEETKISDVEVAGKKTTTNGDKPNDPFAAGNEARRPADFDPFGPEKTDDKKGKTGKDDDAPVEEPVEEPDNKNKDPKEPKEATNNEDDFDDESEEAFEMMEAVLVDFLNNVFVVLPTPAITESLNKLEDKLETVDKLVESWVSLGGGVKMLKRRADQAGLNGDDIVENIKAVLLNEAFQRFNLPMPFEDILDKGKSGGMMSYITKCVDLDSNTIFFLTEWEKSIRKNEKKAEKLRTRIDNLNNQQADVDLDQNTAPTNESASDDIFNQDVSEVDEELAEVPNGEKEEIKVPESDTGGEITPEVKDETSGGADDIWAQ